MAVDFKSDNSVGRLMADNDALRESTQLLLHCGIAQGKSELGETFDQLIWLIDIGSSVLLQIEDMRPRDVTSFDFSRIRRIRNPKIRKWTLPLVRENGHAVHENTVRRKLTTSNRYGCYRGAATHIDSSADDMPNEY